MVFSGNINLTPDNNGDNEIFLTCDLLDNGNYLIRFHWGKSSKKCWLVKFRKDLGEVAHLPGAFLESCCHVPNDHVYVTPLPCDDDGFVEFKLDPEGFSCSYVFIDFPHQVMDGGYRYRIDLPSFYDALLQGRELRDSPPEESPIWELPYYANLRYPKRHLN